VFKQRFDGQSTFPGIAHATTGNIFKPIETTHAAWIQSVNKGSGLFPAVGETAAIPLSTPHVTNKQTTLVTTFAQAIDISKQLFDDNMHGVWAEDVRDFADKALAYAGLHCVQRSSATASRRLSPLMVPQSSLPTPSSVVVRRSNNWHRSTDPDDVSTTALTNMIAAERPVWSHPWLAASEGAPCSYRLAIWKHAIEITDSALIADLANNNINVYRSALGITVWTSPYLGAWRQVVRTRLGSSLAAAPRLHPSHPPGCSDRTHSRGSTAITSPIAIRRTSVRRTFVQTTQVPTEVLGSVRVQ
jgi:hypothetical protein